MALWMPKSLEAIISIWGILKAGAAFVPVDPAAPVSRLATIARDCEVRALVTAMDRADDLHDEFGAERTDARGSSIPAMALVLSRERAVVLR